jgi:hypothetical protein
MKTVRIGLSRLSVIEVISNVTSIIAHLDGNPHFPNLPYSIEDLNATLEDLIDIQNRMTSGVIRIRYVRDAAVERVLAQMSCCAQYVNSVAKGNTDVLQTSGFQLRDDKSPKPVPNKIPAISARNYVNSGQVKVSWKGVPTRTYYIVQHGMKSEDGIEWTDISISTKTNMVLTDIPIGQYSAFRVAAVNGKGQGHWSNPVTLMVG